jgi:hypothetical protein
LGGAAASSRTSQRAFAESWTGLGGLAAAPEAAAGRHRSMAATAAISVSVGRRTEVM